MWWGIQQPMKLDEKKKVKSKTKQTTSKAKKPQ